MNRNLSHLDALLEKRNLSGGDRLASLNRSIDSIEQRLGRIGSLSSEPGYQGGSASNYSKIEELKRNIQELSTGLSGLSGRRGPLNVQSPGGTASGYGGTAFPSDPLAEIAARKRALYNNAYNSEAPGNHPSANPPSQPVVAPHAAPQTASVGVEIETSKIVGELNAKIDALREGLAAEIGGIQKAVDENSETTVKNIEALSSGDDLDRIAEGIRELQQAPRYDPSAFDALHNDLDELRLSLGAAVRHEDFNNGINDLSTRLDNISSTIPAVDPNALDDIKAQLDLIEANSANNNNQTLLNRLDVMGENVNQLSGSFSVEKLEQRLDSLVESVDQLANRAQSSEPEDTGLAAIEARLDEITRAIVAVTVADQPQPTVDQDAIDRLEERIVQLGQGLELIAQKNDDAQFAQLAERIEMLAGNLDEMGTSLKNTIASPEPASGISAEIEQQLKQLASRLDMSAVEKNREEDQLSQLTNRIEGLSDKFGAMSIAVQNGEPGEGAAATIVTDTTQIERQLEQLARQLDAAVTASSADNQLQNLELQIADIAARLGADTAVTVDLGEVENRLGMIEQSIVADRDFTLEAASQAARSAVEMMGDQGISGELISALAEDLRTLQNTATQTEAKASETLESVKGALGTIVDRLGLIENQITEVASARSIADSEKSRFENTVASDQKTAPVKKNTAIAGPAVHNSRPLEVNPGLLAQIDQAPSIDPSGVLQKDKSVRTEDNRPLEPGSGAPDISALVKRASDKVTSAGSDVKLDVDQTDYVAAARRATKAAISEVNAAQKEVPKKSASFDVKAILAKTPRRPVIIAAAAVLMAIIAFAGSKVWLGNSADTARVAAAPAAIEAPVVPAESAETNTEASGEPVKAARKAVSNTAASADTETKVEVGTNSDGSAMAVENIVAPPVNTGADSLATSEFSTNKPANQTNRFTARSDAENTTTPAPSMAETANASGDVAASGSSSANEGARKTKITSEPLPPAHLGPVSLRQAAANGDPRAQFEIALRYTKGKIVKRDLAKAAIWYEKAAAQEFAPAQYRLGSLYEKGLGVKRDLSTASNWYRRAAELGNARAMHNLAVINTMGASGKPNMAEAVTWFTKAANLGVKDSQFNLGILHGQGMGVKQDLAASYKWFALAAKTGDADSAKKKDEVANVMDPKALDKARIQVRNWKPGKLNEQANRVVIPEQWRGKGGTSAKLSTGKQAVMQTQAMLNKLGYNVGRPDGLVGPKTRRAIVNFQKKTGLAPTGIIDAELVKTLQGLSV